jgi:hypothetical protein
MAESIFQRTFAGGELAPSLAARADLTKYVTGLRRCRNFVVLRHGGVANRAGLRYVETAKDGGDTSTFLMRYVSEVAGESLLIEVGVFYLRFYKNGALVRIVAPDAWSAGPAYSIGAIVESGGTLYYSIKAHTNQAPPNATYWYAMPDDILELPTPFGADGFQWVQNGRVITLTSLTHPPHELIYVGLTSWVIRQVVTTPGVEPPTAIVITPGPAGSESFSYIVTSAAPDTYEESTGSVITQVNTVTEGTPASPHVLTWTPPAGPVPPEYYVYKDPYGNGTFGFIGTAVGAPSFRDTGFIPDFAVTPPMPRVLFATTDNYPLTAAYYQQRRLFAHTKAEPEAVWGSRTGFASNFTISSPLQDDDAITFKISGNEHNPVRHLIGLKTLIVLTDAGGWVVGVSMTPLTPANLPADQEIFVGANGTRPVLVGNAILYVQTRGAVLHDLQFDMQVEGLGGKDLSLFAAHLFDGFTLDQMDYAQTPHSIVWACRSDGTLLGLTYVREQDVWGWHRHDTGASGRFEDVCVVPEADQDAVYVLVRRTIGGDFVRSIERLESREIQNWNADSFFVDAGLTYSGAPVTSIAGLAHLEGEVVAVVADGVVIFNGDPDALPATVAAFTVTGGTIAHVFNPPASVIHAGLPIRHAEIELLDLDVQGVEIRDNKKRVAAISVLLDASVRTWQAGPDAAHLVPVKLKTFELGQERLPFTGIEEIILEADYGDAGRVFIRHVDPLPLTILGCLPSVQLGG